MGEQQNDSMTTRSTSFDARTTPATATATRAPGLTGSGRTMLTAVGVRHELDRVYDERGIALGPWSDRVRHPSHRLRP